MKTVYLTFVFHGNMAYDRYTKNVIRREFPKIYQMVIEDFKVFPQLRAQVQLSGVTIESLRMVAPTLLEEFIALEKKGQIKFTGTYYSEPVNVCMDGETDLACAQLGTEIVRKKLAVPSGFFPQEQSYHPQLPWILKKLGLKWITIHDPTRNLCAPYVLKGLDGTEIVGFPVIGWHTLSEQDLDRFYAAAENSIYTLVGDFEIPPNLKQMVGKVERMKAEGKNLEFITISEYLKRFGPQGKRFYSICSWVNTMDNPSFSQWVSDPQDIIVHNYTHRAMNAVKNAHILTGVVKYFYSKNIDYDLTQAKTTLMEDPLIEDVEQAKEFSYIEKDFLSPSGKVTLLSRAKHLLLWGVNSDARGWTPLLERRRERINSLQNATLLSQEVIHNGLRLIGNSLDVPKEKFEEKFERYFLIYNPIQKREETIKFSLGLPYEIFDPDGNKLASVNYYDRGKCTTEARIPLPSYGYTCVFLKGSSKIEKPSFTAGNVIKNKFIKLQFQDEKVIISAAGQNFNLKLDPFYIYEVIRGHPACRLTAIKPGRASSKVRRLLYPQLMINHKLDWCIYMTAKFTLVNKEIICSYEFNFPRPVMIVPPGITAYGSLWWDPRGLIVSLTGEEGEIYYDTPFATSHHINKSLSFVTALRYACLQSKKGGIAVISQTGAQSFKYDPGATQLGICLGASTLGGPPEPNECEVIPEKRLVIHHERWEREMFLGRYTHQFVIYPYTGNFTQAHVPKMARAYTEPIYIQEIDKDNEKLHSVPRTDEPEKSFVTISSPNVELTSLQLSPQGKVKIRLNEMEGRTTDTQIKIGREEWSERIPPNGIIER